MKGFFEEHGRLFLCCLWATMFCIWLVIASGLKWGDITAPIFLVIGLSLIGFLVTTVKWFAISMLLSVLTFFPLNLYMMGGEGFIFQLLGISNIASFFLSYFCLISGKRRYDLSQID